MTRFGVGLVAFGIVMLSLFVTTIGGVLAAMPTNVVESAFYGTNTIRMTATNESRELMANMVAKDGTVCRLYGHNWRDGRPGESDTVRFADYHPGVSYRTCKLCGKTETQSLEWK